MKKILSFKGLALVLSLLFLFSLTGCGGAETPEGDREITDELGRTVTVAENPTIASPYYITTMITLAINGGTENIAAIEDTEKTPARTFYSEYFPELLSIRGIGTGKGINFEEATAANPGLFITPPKFYDSIAQLEELNIPAIAVNPETLEGLLSAYEMIGSAVGNEDRAKKLSEFTTDKLDEVKKAVEGADRPKVYIAGVSDPLKTATRDMFQSELIRIAGGENLGDAVEGGGWVIISPEQLNVFAPDIILVAANPKYDPNLLYDDPVWQDIPAVKNGEIYTFPATMDNWDSPTPACVLGGLWAASVLHPDLINRDELSDTVSEFYKTFYDCEVTFDEVDPNMSVSIEKTQE